MIAARQRRRVQAKVRVASERAAVVAAAENSQKRAPECEQSKSLSQQLAMMIGHCIFIIKHFCAAVNFDYRLGGKLKIYFQAAAAERQCQLLPPTYIQKPVISRRYTHSLYICAGRANADVVFLRPLNCPTSFAAVRKF